MSSLTSALGALPNISRLRMVEDVDGSRKGEFDGGNVIKQRREPRESEETVAG